MFTQKFITVRKGLVACIYSESLVLFREGSKLGAVVKQLSADEARAVVADLKGFDAKSILTAAFEGRALVA